MNLDIKIPKLLLPIFKKYRYKILYGGRSSGKSASVIRYLIVRAMQRKTKILCTRETQTSIQHSTYAELRDLIYELNLQYDAKLNPDGMFIVKHDGIICTNGSEFIFKGLSRDIMQIKSIPNIDICFVEEADTIKANEWNILIPTIRAENSEIIICFNPRDAHSDTYQKFIEAPQSNDELRIEINYPDNPFNSQVILDEIAKLKKYNYALYEHVYLGKVLDISEQVIFKGCFEIRELEINPLTQVRYGQDYGFSQDPFAMVQVWLIDDHTIYIDSEIYEIGLLPTKIPSRVRAVMPNAMRKRIAGDAARPDTIAELNNLGLNVEAAPKLKGSIESGIQYLQGKKIIIHPRCVNTIFEFYNYKYEQDKEGTILAKPIDKHNHILDACLSADSLINTENGLIKISDMVGTVGRVWSFNEETQTSELNDYYDVRITQPSAITYDVELEDGRIITATENHPLLTQRGWVELRDLTIEDKIMDISQSMV